MLAYDYNKPVLINNLIKVNISDLKQDSSAYNTWQNDEMACRTELVVFVDRLIEMVHFAPYRTSVSGKEAASLFLDHVYRLLVVPESIVSDRNPRFTSGFMCHVFELLVASSTCLPPIIPKPMADRTGQSWFGGCIAHSSCHWRDG